MARFKKKALFLPQAASRRSISPFSYTSPSPQYSFLSSCFPRSIRQCILFFIFLVFPLFIFWSLKSTNAAPTLVLEEPSQSFVTNHPTIIVKGMADPLSTVSVNNELTLLDQEGRFQEFVSLQRGINIISLKARKWRNETLLERTVIYNEP